VHKPWCIWVVVVAKFSTNALYRLEDGAIFEPPCIHYR